MQHEQIEAEEEERVREFQGLPVDDLPVDATRGDNAAPAAPVVRGGGASTPETGATAQAVFAEQRQPVPVDLNSEEHARAERAAFAKAQAAKFSKDVREAKSRGEWGGDNFGKPKDLADRLRRNVPYKYKLKKSWFGEF